MTQLRAREMPLQIILGDRIGDRAMMSGIFLFLTVTYEVLVAVLSDE